VSSFIDPQELVSSILPFISSTFFTTQLQSTVEGLGSAGYASTLNGGMFTLTPTTPANIDMRVATNTIVKINNDNADDFLDTQEYYPFNTVSLKTSFTLNFQQVNLWRAPNLFYGLLFHTNGFVYVHINGTATTNLGLYDSNDTYMIQLTPDNVRYYVNNSLVDSLGSAPVSAPYRLQINLTKLNDTIINLAYAGTTSPNIAANSALYFNTPLPLSLNDEIVSTTIAFQTAGFISSANLLSTVGGLGSIGYLSTQISSFLTFSTGFITASTLGLYDSGNNNVLNNVYVKKTYLYFNDYIVGGATQLQPQIFDF
jgi:hypothetical protein